MATKEFIDFDYYGRKDANGSPLLLRNEEAISNAIITYITSKVGDYVNQPLVGGIMESFEFKSLSADFTAAQATLKKDLDSNFGGVTQINVVEFIPDYVNRLLEISVTITIFSTQKSVTFSLFKKVNEDKKYIQEINYIDVPYFGQNLIDWLNMELFEQPKAPLLFNADINAWSWNNYKLINFSQDSNEFQYVLQLIVNFNNTVS